MKLSKMVSKLIDIWREHGDDEVYIDLLTENQSNIIKITDVCWYDGQVSIDAEIEDIKEFKKRIK